MQGAPFSIDPIGIVSALREEQANTPDYLPFKVIARKNEKGIWRLEVTGIGRSVKLDESYEGCKVGWSQPIKGAAQILSVIPEDGIIHVHHGSSSPPPADGVIYLYPPSYLDPLLQYWSDANRHSTTARWLKHYNPDTSSLKPLLPPEKFPLRRKQSSAFDLLKKPLGFLWGPPGTGKTYTLGAMLAQYLIKRPHKRVLLLSATNMALDQALVSVDKALERLSETVPQANAARKACKRLGHQFVARYYSAREHLIPTYDSGLVKLLSALEAEEPEKSDVQRFQRWHKQVEEIREKIKAEAKAALQRTRLAAMTATRAIYTWNDLAELDYDLVVFDESSQISRALSLALLPLGDQALFAGDDKQLAPIARSSSENARRWLSSSLFEDRKNHFSLQCMLTEQSRMSADICHVIGRVFYHDGMPKGDQLEVAAEQAADSAWKRARKPLQLSSIPDKALAVIDVKEKDDGTYSSKMGGHIRYWSAEQCASIAREFQDQGRSEDIHILTPFRAQRSLIRRKLKEAGVRGIKVSTVHRAQGSECHTVLFDPVNGDDNFLHGRDEYEKKSAKRLINVALSRAQAQLIIPLSERDRKNPLFDQIYRLARHRPKNTESFQSLRDFVGKPGFPEVLIGKKIRFHDCTGQVLRLEPYNKCKTWVVINDLEAGKERQFDLEQLLVGIGAVSKTSKIEEPIACPVCSDKANSIEQLSQHVKKHHPELLKELFDCPFCTAKVSLQKYAKHIRLVHQDSDKRKPAPAPAPAPKGGSPCPFCFENVADGNLGLHLAKQCPVKNPKRGRKGSSQLCPICQRYIPSQTYKVHIQGHQKAAAQPSSKPSQPPKRNKVSVSNANTVGKRRKHSLDVPSTNPEIQAYLERTRQR